jgi:hypothetical protein
MATKANAQTQSRIDYARSLAPAIVRYYKDGESLLKIEEVFKLNPFHIYAILKEQGVTLRTEKTKFEGGSGFKIDSNVPMPRSGKPPSLMGIKKYPYDKMSVGDSVLVPGKREGKHAFKSFFSGGRKYGMKFSMRTVFENGVEGVRIWRVS